MIDEPYNQHPTALSERAHDKITLTSVDCVASAACKTLSTKVRNPLSHSAYQTGDWVLFVWPSINQVESLREAIEFLKTHPVMPKNHTKLCTNVKLLRGARPSTILADDFAPDNDNAVWYSNQAAFLNALGTAVQDLQAQGFSTMKSGSCFVDLAGRRAGNQYSTRLLGGAGYVKTARLLLSETQISA